MTNLCYFHLFFLQQGGTQTFDQMLLILITAVTDNAPKKTVVDILTEAQEQGIDARKLVNGLCKRDVPEGRTPLAYAAKMNLCAMADHLLDLGASVNQRMKDNVTALSLAATNSRWDGTEMVQLLLSKRADPSVLATAGVDVKTLNVTMQYWLGISEASPPISDDDVEHLENTAPMHKMHELT
jgi:ankyrin repeat protein